MKRFQQTGLGLGSDITLTLVLDQKDPDNLFSLVWKHITQFEQCFSRFLPESELSHFNNAAGKRQAISPELQSLLVASKRISELTDGLFNPFILPSLQRAGYVGSWPSPNQYRKSQDYRNRSAVVPIDQLVIEPGHATIPVNSALDFGGIGKGYLLDELAELLHSYDVRDFWLSIGGDIVCDGHDSDGSPWNIYISDATNSDKVIGSFKNDGTLIAVATSGVTKRKGVENNEEWHHIIDPRTGKSAKTDILTVSLTAQSGVHADVAAKCLVILGSTNQGSVISRLGVKEVLVQTNHKVKKAAL